jgi:hypothetical protein
MAFHPVALDILTQNYRISGQVYIGNQGITGTLIDKNSSYLDVRGAKVARVSSYESLSQAENISYVMKNQIVAVCLEKREDLGVASTRFSKMANLTVRLTTSVYEIEGGLEWSGRFEFGMLLAENLSDWIPLWDASLGGILFSSLFVQSPILLINRKFLATLVVIGEQV